MLQRACCVFKESPNQGRLSSQASLGYRSKTTSQLLVRLLLEQLAVRATVSDLGSLCHYFEHIACETVVDRGHEYPRACIHEEQMSRQSFKNGQSFFPLLHSS